VICKGLLLPQVVEFLVGGDKVEKAREQLHAQAKM
jgi:hypothetical protein